MTGSWPKQDLSVPNHGRVLWAQGKVTSRLAIYKALLDHLAVLDQVTQDSLNWMSFSDYSFSDLKTFTSCQSFSHSIENKQILILDNFFNINQGMRLSSWECHDLSFQPTGTRLAPMVWEFVDIHFSHTAGSHTMPSHPSWPLSTQLSCHNRAKIGLIHDCHVRRIHLQTSFVWNSPKSAALMLFSMWVFFSYLLLWEFVHDLIYNLLFQTKAWQWFLLVWCERAKGLFG